MSYWDLIPASGLYGPARWPARELADLGWRGLQTFTPNLASLLAGEPAPPLANLPGTPGKVPSVDDPRPSLAAGELANVGINFVPLPVPAGGGIARGILGPLGRRTSASEMRAAYMRPGWYDPPSMPQRPFAADYPHGAATTGIAGRLLEDIEGRPLVAHWVVGRNKLGRDDLPFPEGRLNALTEALTGKPPKIVPPEQIQGADGLFWADDETRGAARVYLSNTLEPETKPKVLRHELGHAMHTLAGNPPVEAHIRELNAIYNELNNSYLAAARKRNPTLSPNAVPWESPKTHGYTRDQAPFEYFAEAARAYLTNPNYIKTLAPETAKAVRKIVNSHPILREIIQFNTLAALASNLDLGSLPVPKQTAPEF